MICAWGEHEIVRGDVLEVLRTLPDDSFDAVLTDPPYFIDFMSKGWDAAGADISVNESNFRSWLAGLIAGEGYFRIQKVHKGTSYQCNFGIHMRADEGPLLRALQRHLGIGRIVEEPEVTGRAVNSKPSVRWLVEDQGGCRKLASVLDGAPLYGKKQREYDVWRKALGIWLSKPKGHRWKGRPDRSDFEACFHELQSLRPYDENLATSDFNPFGGGAYSKHFEWLSETYRVLKPGAPLLIFSATRTYHRLATAVEDAGFELRDQLLWLFAKGFPKSQNTAKALGEDTEEGETWRGYGSALKPAYEPICLARKPLDGTMANNVKKWGCGPIAIDACRIGDVGGTTKGTKPTTTSKNAYGNGLNGGNVVELDEGRWPANVLFDEGAAEHLDEVVGNRPSRKSVTRNGGGNAGGAVFDKRTAGRAKPDSGRNENGGPSRFYFCAKVSTKEREFGCAELARKSAGEVTGGRREGSAGLQSPRAGAGRTSGASNTHPTLKPIALNEYLAKLIKPPTVDATLLVPYSGAGSEMIGALRAGWPNVLGIERDIDDEGQVAGYIEIAEARIEAWRGAANEVKEAA